MSANFPSVPPLRHLMTVLGLVHCTIPRTTNPRTTIPNASIPRTTNPRTDQS
jgi:hypothetical protein